MATISKTFTFEAAHRLLRHDGKCRNLHGHSYRVEVEIIGPVQASGVGDMRNPQAGMVLDFSLVKKWWQKLEPSFDHQVILEDGDPMIAALESLGREGTSMHVMEFAPTAENLAGWIRDDLSNWLISEVGWTNGFVTPRVRVWETATSWAEA